MEDPQASKKPKDTPFTQQTMSAWRPILTPQWVIAVFFFIGILFIPIGSSIQSASDDIIEHKHKYDGEDSDSSACKITSQNQATRCNITFNINEEMEGPVYLYYGIDNFYQNHRRYVKSRDAEQLQGTIKSKSDLDNCDPLTENGNLLLNPCGLIANSLFNDVITLADDDGVGLVVDETGIAWDSDVEDKFKQPDGFEYEVKTGNCATQLGSSNANETVYEGVTYCYLYPKDDTTQYLYESYPQVINPIEGVTNEHFIVWMRTAALPNFRKLYGIIDSDIPKGTTLRFEVEANFLVSTFDGGKYLILSTSSWVGGKNSFLGACYITVGVLSLLISGAFAFKQWKDPRKLGDPKYLGLKEL